MERKHLAGSVVTLVLVLLFLAWWFWPAQSTEVDALVELVPKHRVSVELGDAEEEPIPDIPAAVDEAFGALAPHVQNRGYITCALPSRVPNGHLAMTYPEWHGSTVTGFPHEPEGAETVYRGVENGIEGDTGLLEEPVALYRWWDATQGNKGVCEVETIEEATLYGVVRGPTGVMADYTFEVCDAEITTDSAGRFSHDTWQGMFCFVDTPGKTNVGVAGQEPFMITSFSMPTDSNRLDIEVVVEPRHEAVEPTPEEAIEDMEDTLELLWEPEFNPAELAMKKEGLSEESLAILRRFRAREVKEQADRDEFRVKVEGGIENRLDEIEDRELEEAEERGDDADQEL